MCVSGASYRVEEDSEEELPSSDALVQLLWASWVFVIEDCMGEETACLPGQHLKHTHTWLKLLNFLVQRPHPNPITGDWHWQSSPDSNPHLHTDSIPVSLWIKVQQWSISLAPTYTSFATVESMFFLLYYPEPTNKLVCWKNGRVACVVLHSASSVVKSATSVL